eukprot:8671774-Alexandrium_andersonii.AAC.1
MQPLLHHFGVRARGCTTASPGPRASRTPVFNGACIESSCRPTANMNASSVAASGSAPTGPAPRTSAASVGAFGT